MIRREELTCIGRFVKPHGIKGELNAGLDIGLDSLDALSCIVVDVDGIYVPFFIDSVRPRGSESALLTLEGISNENAAADFSGKDFFALTSELGEEVDGDDDGFFISDLIGYNVIDMPGGTLVGEVTDFDDSTANVVLLVQRPDGENIYIPAADELFISIDPESRTVAMDLPEGLF